MDKNFFANPWNLAALAVIAVILGLAWYSVQIGLMSVSIAEGEQGTVSLEVVFRFLFNPLWGLVLFFFARAHRLNDESRKKIINMLLGLLESEKDTFTAKQISRIILSPEDEKIRERIEAQIKQNDPISEELGDPVIKNYG